MIIDDIDLKSKILVEFLKNHACHPVDGDEMWYDGNLYVYESVIPDDVAFEPSCYIV